MNELVRFGLMAATLVVVELSAAGPASADTVQATRKLRMMERPGDDSRVVDRVPAGREMTVLERRGRWLRVRVGGESGWVTRTAVRSAAGAFAGRDPVGSGQARRGFSGNVSPGRGRWSGPAEDRVGVDAAEGDDVGGRRLARGERPARDGWGERDPWDGDDVRGRDGRGRNGRRSGAAAEPDEARVRVWVDEAEVYRRPSRGAANAYRVDRGDALYVLATDGDWVEVENDDGEVGWIRDADVEAQLPRRYPSLGYAVDVGLGFATLGSRFRSDGAGPLANYQVSSSAASLQVGTQVLYTGGSETLVVIADARYRGARATPGIRYDDGAGGVSDIGFTKHELDVGAAIGYRFRREDGLVTVARAGYHLGLFDVHDVELTDTVNLARLPSELLTGFVVGARVGAPRLYRRWGAMVGLDAMLGGSLSQTTGLEDGAAASVSSWWGVGEVNYEWKPELKLLAAYRYVAASAEFAGAAPGSMRGHNATAATRDDTLHTVTVGLGASF
jgi:SH3-like domain-containing protein